METSILLARILGPVMAIIGAGVLINRDYLKKTVKDLIGSPALILFMGIFTMVLGLLMVLNHNIWTGGWPIIVTVLSWIVFVKGALLVLFPESILQMKMIKNESMYTACGLFHLIVGAYLMYVSYLV